ncbi:MAG: hypothetical protein EHJ95_06730 [Methanobacteriota archaeon]|nr:MAG: hypothetical protein EHJ95_06730 [Euryarchaeota archaeon]
MGKMEMMGDRDAITVNNGSENKNTEAYNVVIDHSTLIWGPDIGGVSFLYGTHDVTVSNSIIGEGLYHSRHPEANGSRGINGMHSMAMNISELDPFRHPRRITVHHNLLTTSSDRNPRVMGGENIDIVNNVIYNWQKAPSQGDPRSVNLIKNFYIMGPMTNRQDALVIWQPVGGEDGSLRAGTVYESGNIAEGFIRLRGDPQSVYGDNLFAPYSIRHEDSPQEAYAKIVKSVGANMQVAGKDGRFRRKRDSVDRRIIRNLETRSGRFFNGTEKGGIADLDEITWPDLTGGVPGQDADLDGMPDAWERKFFGHTKRGSVNDSSSDYDRDGYTDLEEYLNQTNPLGNYYSLYRKAHLPEY